MSNSGRWPTAITIHVSYFADGILAGKRQVSRAVVIHFAVRPFTNRDTRNWSNGKRACSAAEILPLGNLGSVRSTGLIWLRPAIEYYVNITTDTVIVIIAPREALLVQIHLRYVEIPRLFVIWYALLNITTLVFWWRWFFPLFAAVVVE